MQLPADLSCCKLPALPRYSWLMQPDAAPRPLPQPDCGREAWLPEKQGPGRQRRRSCMLRSLVGARTLKHSSALPAGASSWAGLGTAQSRRALMKARAVPVGCWAWSACPARRLWAAPCPAGAWLAAASARPGDPSLSPERGLCSVGDRAGRRRTLHRTAPSHCRACCAACS